MKKNRRQFIREATLGTAALGLAACSPTDPAMADPTPATPAKVTVGHGDFRYTVDKNWGNLDPTTQGLQHCHEMVIDSRGRLACSVVSKHFDVLLYNEKGKLTGSFNHNLTEPHGLTVAGEGKDQTFWLTDPETGRVLNLDLDGRLLRELSVPPDQIPEGKQFKPTETTVSSSGEIYVADGYGTDQIFHYDAQGKLKNVFGGPDHFSCAHGIVVDGRRGTDELLITSRGKNNFQRWSMDGEHLSTRDLPGLWICRPVLMGDHTAFAVIVTDSWYHYDGMVAILDKDFNVVSLPGGSAPTGQEDFNDVRWDEQTFMSPHDVCPDADGNLYVPQWYSGRTYPVRLKLV